jgi:hypothetical protein
MATQASTSKYVVFSAEQEPFCGFFMHIDFLYYIDQVDIRYIELLAMLAERTPELHIEKQLRYLDRPAKFRCKFQDSGLSFSTIHA